MLNGLEGAEPQSVDPTRLAARTQELKNNADLLLAGEKAVPFLYTRDMLPHKGLFRPGTPMP